MSAETTPVSPLNPLLLNAELVFRFGVAAVEQHYHLPLKFTPWGFSLHCGGAEGTRKLTSPNVPDEVDSLRHRGSGSSYRNVPSGISRSAPATLLD